MLIDTTLLVDRPEIVKGLLDGSMQRYGSVIRGAAGTEQGGQIVAHLTESSSMAGQFTGLPLNQTLSSMMGLSQIAAGASVLNLGVSVAGFAYMGYKLHQVQKSLGHLQQSMEAGFHRVELGLSRIQNTLVEGIGELALSLDRVENRLDAISGQLAYLYLLVEDSRDRQEKLARAVSHLHQAMLIKEIASLRAELSDRSRFPEESPRQALKTASRVRAFMGSEAMKIAPELNAELMLNGDIAVQGWAVATATEANLLLEIGQHGEAKQLLAEEVPMFQQVAQRWATKLISKDENEHLNTTYRLNVPGLRSHIQPERVERIAEITPGDRDLSPDDIRRKQNQAEVELEMSYAKTRYGQQWQHRQIAIAEYLDGLSELTARLDSLQSFAELCESQQVKSSKELLPRADAKDGLYVISPN